MKRRYTILVSEVDIPEHEIASVDENPEAIVKAVRAKKRRLHATGQSFRTIRVRDNDRKDRSCRRTVGQSPPARSNGMPN